MVEFLSPPQDVGDQSNFDYSTHTKNVQEPSLYVFERIYR